MLATLAQFAQDYTYSYDYSSPVTTTSSSSIPAGLIWGIVLVGLALLVVMLVSMWKIFTKAGKPGWAAIVPIYNMIVLLQIVGRPVWWILLFLLGAIPFVGSIVVLVVEIIVYHDLSKSFGRDVGTTLLLIFLPFIGFPMLAFGDAKYKGPSALNTTGGAAGTGPAAPTHPAATPPANPVA